MTWLACILSNVALASLLALAAWSVQRWLNRPAIARALWVLVLVKLITPPMLNLSLGGPFGHARLHAGNLRLSESRASRLDCP